MRAKTRNHRIVAALCAVPFLVLAGAGAASAVPAAVPAAAASHSHTGGWGCDDSRWGSDCYDGGYGGYSHHDFYNRDYNHDHGSGFAVFIYYGR